MLIIFITVLYQGALPCDLVIKQCVDIPEFVEISRVCIEIFSFIICVFLDN